MLEEPTNPFGEGSFVGAEPPDERGLVGAGSDDRDRHAKPVPQGDRGAQGVRGEDVQPEVACQLLESLRHAVDQLAAVRQGAVDVEDEVLEPDGIGVRDLDGEHVQPSCGAAPIGSVSMADHAHALPRRIARRRPSNRH